MNPLKKVPAKFIQSSSPISPIFIRMNGSDQQRSLRKRVLFAQTGEAAIRNKFSQLDDLIYLPIPIREDSVIRALQARFLKQKYLVRHRKVVSMNYLIPKIHLDFKTTIGPVGVAVNSYRELDNPVTLGSTKCLLESNLSQIVQEAVKMQSESGYNQASNSKHIQSLLLEKP